MLVILILNCEAFTNTGDTVEEYTDSDYEVELTINDTVILGRFGDTPTEEEIIVMSLGEIQEIFGRKEEEEQPLTRRQKRKAKDCRKKNTLYSRTDGECHPPTATEPCTQGKWLIAEKGRLDGVCVINPCPSPEAPILFQGSCSPVYGPCGTSSRLYLNKRGQSFCHCDEGFSYNRDDGECYRDNTRGPCNQSQTWLKKSNGAKSRRKGATRRTLRRGGTLGVCRRTRCGTGQVRWRGGVCLTPDTGPGYYSCVRSNTGILETKDGKLNCRERERDSASDREAQRRTMENLVFGGK